MQSIWLCSLQLFTLITQGTTFALAASSTAPICSFSIGFKLLVRKWFLGDKIPKSGPVTPQNRTEPTGSSLTLVPPSLTAKISSIDYIVYQHLVCSMLVNGLCSGNFGGSRGLAPLAPLTIVVTLALFPSSHSSASHLKHPPPSP